jgi:putative AdoMet-dependent methyltransferase
VTFCEKMPETHFREEFSTYDWVMDGLFTHAGFEITHKQVDGGVLVTYVCRSIEGSPY